MKDIFPPTLPAVQEDDLSPMTRLSGADFRISSLSLSNGFSRMALPSADSP